jgi:hypothetical protein
LPGWLVAVFPLQAMMRRRGVDLGERKFSRQVERVRMKMHLFIYFQIVCTEADAVFASIPVGKHLEAF